MIVCTSSTTVHNSCLAVYMIPSGIIHKIMDMSVLLHIYICTCMHCLCVCMCVCVDITCVQLHKHAQTHYFCTQYDCMVLLLKLSMNDFV